MVLAVIGAGMVGCATALSLKKRGHEVIVYERRPDPRTDESNEVGRSINLAISARGLSSLRSVDPKLCADIESIWVPMRGRMVHTGTKMSPVLYGIHGTEAINSISRMDLNNRMIAAVEEAGVEIKFNHAATASYDELMKLGTTVFGCDGSYSKVREAISRKTDYKLIMETVSTSYMEIPIAKAEHWERNYLHVWPRGSHMLIALPNADGSFTGTLFAPTPVFDKSLETPETFADWFTTEFEDAAPVIGIDNLKKLAINSLRGRLTSLKYEPYNIGGDIILLGDAAHSMVPFYGQGLNAGLEDVRVLFEKFIDKKYRDPSQWSLAFDEYSAYRKPDCDAINTLSMNNYKEMRDSVTTLGFRVRKKIDDALARVLGDRWLPLYTMVSFRDDIRYSDALASSAWQQKVIGGVLATVGGSGLLALALALFKLHASRRR